MNLTFNKEISKSAIGLFLSHYTAWYKVLNLNSVSSSIPLSTTTTRRRKYRPIISLESDVYAINEWNINPSVYQDYDIVFLSAVTLSIKECPIPTCKSKNMNHIVTDAKYWYGTGAVLFTAARPQYSLQALSSGEFYGSKKLKSRVINHPLDWHLRRLFRVGKLKVGQLCPPRYYHPLLHESTIFTDKKNSSNINRTYYSRAQREYMETQASQQNKSIRWTG